MGSNFQNNIVILQGADLEICLDTSYNNYICVLKNGP